MEKIKNTISANNTLFESSLITLKEATNTNMNQLKSLRDETAKNLELMRLNTNGLEELKDLTGNALFDNLNQDQRIDRSIENPQEFSLANIHVSWFEQSQTKYNIVLVSFHS